MINDDIFEPMEFTAWARLETSDISPLGNVESRTASLSAFLRDQSPEAMIPDGDVPPEAMREIAQAIVESRVVRLEVNRRTLQRLAPELPRSAELASIWLKLHISRALPARRQRQAIRSPDLDGQLSLISVAQVELPKFAAFIGQVFARSTASTEEIRDLIDRHVPGYNEDDLPFATVMDVGQGGMVTVQQRSWHRPVPKLFFDFGWPLKQLEKSTAPAPPDLDAARDAPVVLTHWDFDHYAYALADVHKQNYQWRPGADLRTWLVPGVGPNWGHVLPCTSGILWAMHLFLANRLKVWPHDVAGLTTGFVTIAKTVPYAAFKGDPNQHGLFMILHERVPDDGPREQRKPVAAILIPGDADYQAIKQALYPGIAKSAPFPVNTFAWKGLVATHHGGEFSYDVVPIAALPAKAKHAPRSILAISAGQTHYKHPEAPAQQAYLTGGHWRQHTITFNRRALHLNCRSLSCAVCPCWFSSSDPRGNIELSLDDRRALRGCPLDWQPFQ